MNAVPADLPSLTDLDCNPEVALPRAEAEVVELALLLPRWQVEALEAAARHRGVTTGQMIRRCLGEQLRQLPR